MKYAFALLGAVVLVVTLLDHISRQPRDRIDVVYDSLKVYMKICDSTYNEIMALNKNIKSTDSMEVAVKIWERFKGFEHAKENHTRLSDEYFALRKKQ